MQFGDFFFQLFFFLGKLPNINFFLAKEVTVFYLDFLDLFLFEFDFLF